MRGQPPDLPAGPTDTNRPSLEAAVPGARTGSGPDSVCSSPGYYEVPDQWRTSSVIEPAPPWYRDVTTERRDVPSTQRLVLLSQAADRCAQARWARTSAARCAGAPGAAN